MARRKPRYSRLREKLREENGVPQAGSKTYEFFRFLTGQRSITQANKVSGNAKKRVKIGLHPFAVTPTGTTPGDRFIGYISLYSLKGLRTRANADEADLGIFLISGGEDSESEYYPALIRASYSASGSTTEDNKTSGVTGEQYSYTYKRTFSFPFGRAATTNIVDAETGATETTINDADELDVLRSTVQLLKDSSGTGDPAITIAYEPEIFKFVDAEEALDAQTAIPADVVVS